MERFIEFASYNFVTIWRFTVYIKKCSVLLNLIETMEIKALIVSKSTYLLK